MRNHQPNSQIHIAVWCFPRLMRVRSTFVTSNRLNIAPPQRQFQISAVVGYDGAMCMKQMSNTPGFDVCDFSGQHLLDPMHLCLTRTPHLWPLVADCCKLQEGTTATKRPRRLNRRTQRWTLQGVSSVRLILASLDLLPNTGPSRITGWWFEPLWKILVNWDDYSQYMGK